jgi:hypothetical protein
VVLLLRQFSAEPTILRPAMADLTKRPARRARYTTSTDSTGERGGGKARTFGSSRMQALSLKGEITIAS